jgi:uncharacterized damage-inducible protein DinB
VLGYIQARGEPQRIETNQENTPMTPTDFGRNLGTVKEFFDRSTSCLTEELSGYRPKEDMMTVAQQVAHVASTFDWFIDGAFNRPDGFEMEFENHMKEIAAVTSLRAARETLNNSVARAIKTIESKSMEELMAPLPDGPVMGGAPTLAILSGIEEHTAHHRGVLAVYSRLNGLVPPMPYGDF